jgi:hypothetical protein
MSRYATFLDTSRHSKSPQRLPHFSNLHKKKGKEKTNARSICIRSQLSKKTEEEKGIYRKRNEGAASVWPFKH